MLTTVGLFPTTTKAEEALSLWRTETVDPKKVSIVVQKRMMLLHMARYDKLDQVKHSGIIQRAPLDRLAGMLVGIGATTVPGLGSVVAAGPLAAIVTKATGGLANALESVQLPVKAARQIRDGLRQGQVLLAVHNAPEGPALMSATQATEYYHYRLQLTPSPGTRHTKKLKYSSEMLPVEQ